MKREIQRIGAATACVFIMGGLLMVNSPYIVFGGALFAILLFWRWVQ